MYACRNLIEGNNEYLEGAAEKCNCKKFLEYSHERVVAQTRLAAMLTSTQYKAFFTPRENDIMTRSNKRFKRCHA